MTNKIDLKAYDIFKYRENKGLPINVMREIVGARSFSHHMFIAELLKYNIEKYADAVNNCPILVLELKLKYSSACEAADFIKRFIDQLNNGISPECKSSGSYLWILKKSEAPDYYMEAVIITFVCGDMLTAAAEIASLCGNIIRHHRKIFDWLLSFPCMVGTMQFPWMMQYLGDGLSPWILDCGYLTDPLD